MRNAIAVFSISGEVNLNLKSSKHGAYAPSRFAFADEDLHTKDKSPCHNVLRVIIVCSTLLNEQPLEATADSYLYTQVIGKLNEQFTINIILANGDRFTFPNFAFD